MKEELGEASGTVRKQSGNSQEKSYEGKKQSFSLRAEHRLPRATYQHGRPASACPGCSLVPGPELGYVSSY